MAEDIVALSVSQLNRYIKDVFAADINLIAVTIKGEISNFTNHVKTGHFYFTLKDETSSIRVVMFKGYASKVPFTVENGMNVIVRGSVQVFERDGTYQIYCQQLEPDGIGALYLAFEQLKQRLSERGLFDPDHKRELPRFPQKIAVATAKTGAALQDILNILSRRYPIATVIVIPTLVQGENAPQSIVESINRAELIENLDLLIVGRGGGSIEDLWAFNDENVAQAIYDCNVPVISAVGHEIDFTIADFVADLRAPTPSAAAELATPDIAELSRHISALSNAIEHHTLSQTKSRLENLKTLYHRLLAVSPERSVLAKEAEVNSLCERLENGCKNAISTKENRYLNSVSMLTALSPLKVITRGYTLSYSGEKLIKITGDITVGDEIKTVVQDGEIISAVTAINKGGANG